MVLRSPQLGLGSKSLSMHDVNGWFELPRFVKSISETVLGCDPTMAISLCSITLGEVGGVVSGDIASLELSRPLAS